MITRTHVSAPRSLLVLLKQHWLDFRLLFVLFLLVTKTNGRLQDALAAVRWHVYCLSSRGCSCLWVSSHTCEPRNCSLKAERQPIDWHSWVGVHVIDDFMKLALFQEDCVEAVVLRAHPAVLEVVL